MAHNRNLIEYFARLALTSEDNDNINLEYVETVLQNGADIDCTDKYGQSIFHEVSLESRMSPVRFYSETLNKRHQKYWMWLLKQLLVFRDGACGLKVK